MNLFFNTHDMNSDADKSSTALEKPWGNICLVSSNCPVHIGVRLAKIDDNKFQCPKGKEIYTCMGSVSNQSKRDRYDLNIFL